jgi:hypothetical protein
MARRTYKLLSEDVLLPQGTSNSKYGVLAPLGMNACVEAYKKQKITNKFIVILLNC